MWFQQGELHSGERDIAIHYKLDSQRRLTSRIELLVPTSLLKSLSAVLIETELYNTWVPRWRFPPIGIASVHKLGQTGRTNQILHFDLDIPWKRDLVLVSNGVEDVDENGLFAIHLGTHYQTTGDAILGTQGTSIIPPPEHGVKRIDFEGCFVFHKCPLDHPLLKSRAQVHPGDQSHTSPTEDLLLVSFSMFTDAKLSSLFPQWIVNFVLQVVIVKIFVLLLSVAEDIENGRRPDHSAAIARKGDEIYDWLEERIQPMLETCA